MAAALADKRGPEKRGPRIGDAASLWNFTPAPGWTKEEAQTLKLCLMRHGVGRWVQILETGLLPGKLIQQLNGQTQRLLGQQSLAAYTGLQVDIDRIRADNDRLVEAERKNGLVINSGPNLTKQQKAQLQEEAKAKYGLSEQELHDVEEQLQELLAARQQPGGGPGAAAGGLAQGSGGAAGGRAQREADLLARDTAGMNQEQKVNFLLHLHEKLQQAAVRLAKAQASGAAGGVQPAAGTAAAGAAAGPGRGAAGSAENEGAVANAAPMQIDGPTAAAAGEPRTVVLLAASKPAAAAPVGKAAGAKRKAGGGGRAARQALSSSSSDEEDWKPTPRIGAGRAQRGAAAAAAMDVDLPAAARAGGSGRAAAAAVAVAADVEQLVGMGFTAKQARDALEESGHDMEAAIEWLVANCV